MTPLKNPAGMKEQPKRWTPNPRHREGNSLFGVHALACPRLFQQNPR
jgi:hypothetical protein